jgi:hypothetical protein
MRSFWAILLAASMAVSACGGSSTGTSGGGSSSSGGTNAGPWIPYTAAPVSGNTGGQSGVFVIPANALAAAPTFVNQGTQTLSLAYAQAITLNGSIGSANLPASYLFAVTDSANNIHIYALDLTSASTPTARQVRSLSLSLPGGA